MPFAKRQAGEFEQNYLKRVQFTEKTAVLFKKMKVFGLRRALRVTPTSTNVRYQEEDLLIDFTLPAGSYASIVVDDLMKKLR